MPRPPSRALGALCGAALLMALAPREVAAQTQPSVPAVNPDEVEESRPLIVGLRGIAETWEDRFIAEHYRSSRFGGAAMVHVPFARFLGAEVEIGYSRTPSESRRDGVAAGMLEYIPMAVAVVAVKETRGAELFGGLGYGMAVFTETTDAGTVSGAKPGLDVRFGARIHTRLIRQQLRPEGVTGPRGLDVELLVGRRQHHAFGLGSGFNFSAWRLGAGMVVRL